MTDRELDAWIAENVMGLKWDASKCRICGWLLVKQDNPRYGCIPGNCSLRPIPARRADEPTNYSTDRNVAAPVLERCLEIWRGQQIHDFLGNLYEALAPIDGKSQAELPDSDIMDLRCLIATPRQLMEAVKAAWPAQTGGGE